MPEMDIKQPGFTYSTCGPFIRNKERVEIYANRKHRFYLQKWTRWTMFSAWYGLWQINRFSIKNSVRQDFET